MIICTAVDDRFGLMFNDRRLSRDKVLVQKISELVKESEQDHLWMNSYSAALWEEKDNLHIAEDFLEKAPEGAICFLENKQIHCYVNRIKKMILFHWNRKYPADFYLDFIPEQNGWLLENQEEFPGSSHEKILMEIWIPNQEESAR